MAVDPKRFNWRAFFSLYVVFSFVVMAVTGFVLFVSPPGRVANWAEWTLMGLTKTQWQALHTTFTTFFVAAGIFHVYFNWNILVSYLKNRLHRGIPRKRELAWSAVAAVALAALTLGEVPPVGYLMDASETASAAWSNPGTEPPVPHAEMLTLAKLAETVKVPADTLRAKLDAAGIPAGEPGATVGTIAESRGMTPAALYALLMKGEAAPAITIAEGGGYGQKSVRQLSEQLQVPLATALENLRRAGIDAGESANVRELAAAHGKLPIELVKLIAGR